MPKAKMKVLRDFLEAGASNFTCISTPLKISFFEKKILEAHRSLTGNGETVPWGGGRSLEPQLLSL